ncbi:MAG: hypothetical protein ACREXM_14435, partial [Gammaproteobacteria bacterium]
LKFNETDIRDGALLVAQNKTGKRLRIAIIGELAKVIDRIMGRKRAYKVRNLALIRKENGQPLTKCALHEVRQGTSRGWGVLPVPRLEG